MRPNYTGFGYAFLGVLIFSFTLPMVKLSLPGFSPWTLTFGRAAIAGGLALIFLWIKQVPVPDRSLWKYIMITSLGIVVGFPVLTTLALQYTTSAHAAVIVAGLPLVTAVLAVIRVNEKVPGAFWLAALVGTLTLIIYAWLNGGSEDINLVADLMLLGAVIAAAVGYAEGAILGRSMPGWQVVSWCVVAFLPISLPVALVSYYLGIDSHVVTPITVGAFLFTALGSMYFGFFAWYRGLAELGLAKGSQVQLLQALLTLAWSALLLGERLSWQTVAAAVVVVTCVAATQIFRAKSAQTR